MRKFTFLITLLAVSLSAITVVAGEKATLEKAAEVVNNTDAGVVINGIRWATRNVDTPGTFVQNPENAGRFYQWNRRAGWAVGSVANWDSSNPESSVWSRANNPCPQGWRLPTQAELQSLTSSRNTWTVRNGISGRLFGTAPNKIFLPASGFLRDSDGSWVKANNFGFYWSSTQDGSGSAMGLTFGRNGANVLTFWWQSSGFSVRCVAKE